ncbi:MAG: aminomethyltransferase beta-barrel domain-containing protein, partial [Candidatus Kapaibacterium sp.]
AVVVGTAEKLAAQSLTADNVNLQKYADLRDARRFHVKIRYKDEGAPATCSTDENGLLHVVFDEPRRAIAPGQSVVLYEGDDVVGGGIIRKASEGR